MKIAMQNMALAFGIKVIALILSALGIADMWMAVFADTGVTILAVLNSFRALKVENNSKKTWFFLKLSYYSTTKN